MRRRLRDRLSGDFNLLSLTITLVLIVPKETLNLSSVIVCRLSCWETNDSTALELVNPFMRACRPIV